MKTYEAVISVIIPIYNVEKYIRRCIESVINQTYQDIEIILVDDESPDGCPAICDEYADQDERIKVIHKKNGGLSDARNAGIDISTGKYLMFIDGDDFIDKEMVEKMYHTIIKDGTDMVLCNYEYVDNAGEVVDREHGDVFDRNTSHIIMNEDEFWEHYCRYGSLYYVIACNKIYKRKLFQKLRFPKGRVHEDEYVLHKIVSRCQKISCIKDKLYFYVQHNNSIMAVKTGIRNIRCLDAFEARVAYFIKNKKYKYIDFTFTNGLAKLLQFINDNDQLTENENRVYHKYNKRWKRLALKILFLRQQPFKTRAKMVIFLIGGLRLYKALVDTYVLISGRRW